MSIDLFRDSPLFQSLVKEAVEEAAAKAAQEARTEGMRELAQATLESRFHTLSADILQALGTADEATLKAAASSDTLEQARARLGLGPQG